MSADDAAKLIKSGDHVFIQGSTSVPETLVDAMTRRGDELRGVVLYSGFSVSNREAPYCKPEYKDSFLVDTCFVSSNVRRWIADGYGATTPRFLGEVPALFRDGTWRVDVCLLNCSMPDKDGYVSFGVSADLAFSASECARVVIAQLNPHMPFSYGDPVIHVSRLDAAVLVDDPLVEVPTPEPGPVETAIGEAIAALIPDGATLQIGVGGIPNAVIRALSGHRHLGLHTEAMTDGVLPLIELDLTGQICAESIGTRIFSGIGGQHDFVYGASRSEGGCSFLAMTSTTTKGMGKIKPVLTQGAGVATTRFQGNYVVTEHGAVDLRGRNLPERARLLISIANPDDREALDRAAFERFGYSYSRLK